MELKKIKNMKSIPFEEYFNNWNPNDDIIVIKVDEEDAANSIVWRLDKDLFSYETFRKEAIENKTLLAEVVAGNVFAEECEVDMLVIMSNKEELYVVISSNFLPPVTVVMGVMSVLTELLNHMEEGGEQ